MNYGKVSGCYSIREIEASIKANRDRLYHAGLKQPIKRSTFCDALEKRRHEVFRTVFHEMVDKAQGIAGKAKKKFTDPLRTHCNRFWRDSNVKPDSSEAMRVRDAYLDSHNLEIDKSRPELGNIGTGPLGKSILGFEQMNYYTPIKKKE